MSDTRLPDQFSDLERFGDWILPSEDERYAKRLASTMEEMQAFYDAAFPRLEEIVSYAETVRLDEGPASDEDRNLALLVFSLITVSFPVEAWKQPHVPDSGATAIPLVGEPSF